MQPSIQPRLEWSWGCLSFQNRTKWLEERSRTVLYPFCTSLLWFLIMRYQDLHENWRSEDTKDLIKDLEHILHVPWSIFCSPFPWSPGKTQFISQIVKIAHKIWNCAYITSILTFHYFISFRGLGDMLHSLTATLHGETSITDIGRVGNMLCNWDITGGDINGGRHHSIWWL